MKPSRLTCTEENFLRLEEILAAQRTQSDELWPLRLRLFGHLTIPFYGSREKKFRFGLLSYSVWLLLRILSAKPVCTISPPAADFLVHIVGNVSKEVDTLAPIVTALCEAGYTVLVLWGSSEPFPKEMFGNLKGVSVWTIPGLADCTAFRSFLISEAISTSSLLWHTFLQLRPLKGGRLALLKCIAWWFHDLLFSKCWERLLGVALARHHFAGVAVVSETAPSTYALCRVALRNGWPIHHFWHGLAGFVFNTRCMANHLFFFSQADCNFFVKHGWPPERVHASGHPRQSRLTKQIRQLRMKPATEGGLRVLFASQPDCVGDFSIQRYRDTMEVVLKAAKNLDLTENEFRVRLHPAESATVYLEMADKYVPKLRSALLSTRSVAEDLAWANVLITPFSTMSIEACYAECFLIWLVVGNFFTEVSEELFRYGYGHKAASWEQLAEKLELCRDPRTRSQLILNLMKTARTLGMINENAAAAAARIMISSGAPDREIDSMCPAAT